MVAGWSVWHPSVSSDRLDSEDPIEGEASKYAFIQIQGCDPVLFRRDTAPVLVNLLTSAYPALRRSADVRLVTLDCTASVVLLPFPCRR